MFIIMNQQKLLLQVPMELVVYYKLSYINPNKNKFVVATETKHIHKYYNRDKQR